MLSLPSAVHSTPSVTNKRTTELLEINSLKTERPKIAIVVDDLGHNSVIAKKLIAIPSILTLAILPHTPQAKKISQLATKKGHEVILHLPMESGFKKELLGKGALLSDMQQKQFEESFLSSASSIPNIVGFNNHMGSLLTQNTEKMEWLMSLALENHWYFLDSKTSESSVAYKIAKELGLPSLSRDIFLDHHTHDHELPDVLANQLEKAKKIAKKRGYVVVICHPYPETYQFLSQQIPQLLEKFQFVSISDLIY